MFNCNYSQDSAFYHTFMELYCQSLLCFFLKGREKYKVPYNPEANITLQKRISTVPRKLMTLLQSVGIEPKTRIGMPV